MQERGHDPIRNLFYRSHDTNLDDAGRLRVEVVCRSCGYNLFGLKQSDRCPECGAPVASSIDGDLLANCPPQWLRLVARGAQANAWVSLLLVASLIGSVFIDGNLLTLAFGSLLIIIWALTCWLLSTPEPSELRAPRVNVIVRSGAAASAVAAGAIALIAANHAAGWPMLLALLIIAWIGFVVAQTAQMHLLARLAYRIPQPIIAERAYARAMWLPWIHAGAGLILLFAGIRINVCCLGIVAVIGVPWAIVTTELLTLGISAFLRIEARTALEKQDRHEQALQDEERRRANGQHGSA